MVNSRRRSFAAGPFFDVIAKRVKVYTEGTPVFLPSSLTNIDPDALGFSPHPPVSVCGTSAIMRDHEVFLGTRSEQIPPCGGPPMLLALTPSTASQSCDQGNDGRFMTFRILPGKSARAPGHDKSNHACSFPMRNSLDNIMAVTEYQPYWPSPVRLGERS